jgi:hypothetical protein
VRSPRSRLTTSCSPSSGRRCTTTAAVSRADRAAAACVSVGSEASLAASMTAASGGARSDHRFRLEADAASQSDGLLQGRCSDPESNQGHADFQASSQNS